MKRADIRKMSALYCICACNVLYSHKGAICYAVNQNRQSPGTIGPYSQGYIVNGFVYTSGQIPVDPVTGQVPAGITAQAEQSCANVGAVLVAAGTGFEKMFKTTCFLADMADFAAFNEVYAKFFASKPARSCVSVKELPKGVLCEIEAIAVKIKMERGKMKRPLCFALAILLLLSLCACGTQTGDDPTTPTTEPVVRDPNMPKKLFAYDLNAIPIATDEMSKDELRQLVLQYFELQLSFQWKTDMDFAFFKTYSGAGTAKEISKENLYGGILYQSGGFGNLYRWLEYYDEQTGVMPMSVALADNGGYGEGAAVTDVELSESGKVTYQKYRSMMALGNQCTSSSSWSWGRVINSVCFGDTCDINVYNGFIPVGGYTYSYEHEGVTYDALTIQDFGKEIPSNPIGYDTDDVIADWNAANGADAMYKCYAQLKPADCVVNGGHAMMVKSVTLFTGKDGKVNYKLSTVVVNEQIEGWGLKDNNVGGKMLYQQGAVEAIYTFEQLQNADYIPFTFPEFLDENDEQDKKHLDLYMSYADELESRNARYTVFADAREKCGNGVEKAETYCSYQGDSISYADFAAMAVGSNYSISDVFVTVTDGSGKVLLKNIYRATYTNYREVFMSYGKHTWETDADGNRIPISDGVEALADGKNVIEVTMQLSTGELLTAYKGTLTQ